MCHINIAVADGKVFKADRATLVNFDGRYRKAWLCFMVVNNPDILVMLGEFHVREDLRCWMWI
jgi:hypothetical protein